MYTPYPLSTVIKSLILVHCYLLHHVSIIRILFVFGRIIELIIRIRPNSKIHYSVQPYIKHFADKFICMCAKCLSGNMPGVIAIRAKIGPITHSRFYLTPGSSKPLNTVAHWQSRALICVVNMNLKLL